MLSDIRQTQNDKQCMISYIKVEPKNVELVGVWGKHEDIYQQYKASVIRCMTR